MENFTTIARNEQYVKEIKKSKFIVSFSQVKSVDQAKNFITDIKKASPKATHNCYAFIVNDNSIVERVSDDGEPKGTAGLPILNVLQKNNLTNIVAIVTQYFGGKSFGANGLIRAYSSTVADGIHDIGLVENRIQKEYTIQIPYSQFDKFQYFAKEDNLLLENKIFAENVSIQTFFDISQEKQKKEKINSSFGNSIKLIEGDVFYKEFQLKHLS